MVIVGCHPHHRRHDRQHSHVCSGTPHTPRDPMGPVPASAPCVGALGSLAFSLACPPLSLHLFLPSPHSWHPFPSRRRPLMCALSCPCPLVPCAAPTSGPLPRGPRALATPPMPSCPLCVSAPQSPPSVFFILWDPSRNPSLAPCGTLPHTSPDLTLTAHGTHMPHPHPHSHTHTHPYAHPHPHPHPIGPLSDSARDPYPSLTPHGTSTLHIHETTPAHPVAPLPHTPCRYRCGVSMPRGPRRPCCSTDCCCCARC